MFKNILLKQNINYSKLLTKNPKLITIPSSSFSSKSTETSAKEFEKKVNTVQKTEEEDYSSVEQYMKVFNEKVYKQNVDLTQKLTEIFKDNEIPSGSKIFTTVNEINKINLNNSSKLLQVFLSQILKYNDSVRLFIQQSEKKNKRYNYLIPMSLFFLWICGSLFIYSFYKRNFVNYESVYDNLVKSYNDLAPKSLKLNIKFPIYEDHKNLTNLLNYDSYKHIVVIGPHSAGKTESVKHFCLSQALKDVLSIYVDLNSTNEEDFQSLVSNTLLQSYTGSDINALNLNNFTSEIGKQKLLDFLKKKTVYFVFDNYNHERDRNKVFNSSLPNIMCNNNWKSLVVSSTNELYQNALENSLEIKYLNFLQTRTFKNYLVEKLNTYVKKRVDYSNLELFSEENINTLYRKMYFVSFEDLFRYIEANNSIESFINDKENYVSKKIKMLKVKDPQVYDLLGKLVNSSGVKPFDWNKLPSATSQDSLNTLEKLELIFVKDYSDYVFIYGGLKDLMAKNKI